MKKIILLILLALPLSFFESPVILAEEGPVTLQNGWKASSRLAKGVQKEILFFGTKNDPIAFEITRKGTVRFNVEIFEAKTKIRVKEVWIDKSTRMTFVPKKTTNYTMVFTGYYNSGSYTIVMKRDEEFLSFRSAKILSQGQRKVGAIAEGQVITYKFSGKKNEPYVFRIDRGGEVRYNFRIIDPDTNTVIRQRWLQWDGGEEIIFTPQETKKYKVVLEGYYFYGKYVLQVKKLKGSKFFRGTKRLPFRQNKIEVLAEDVVHAYEFSGKKNIPILFSLHKSGDLEYQFRIVNSQGEDVIRGKWMKTNDKREIVFTPRTSEKYTVLIRGYEFSGKYLLRAEKLR